MRATPRVIYLALLLLGPLPFPALAQTYDRPEAARQDPDFELQGEYKDSTRGMQVIARGDGEFEVVIYPGGLPGAGWDGQPKQSLDVDADQVESMIRKFDRVVRKSPTLGAKPPTGAVVLFDGSSESLDKHWQDGAKMTKDGLLQEGATSIDRFGDYTLHLEFRLPFMPSATGQGRANSGIYHQGRYETQILDSFGLEGKDNEAGGLYSQRAPDLNMCLPPLAWQTYDVDLTAAKFDAQGKKVANAKITVKLNGVVVHSNVDLSGPTPGSMLPDNAEPGPIHLQQHGNPVRFRNIWVLPRDLSAEAKRPIVPGFERFHALGQSPTDGGRLLMGELNCTACHPSNAAEAISSKQAPILDGVGKRIRAEWIVNYLSDPHAIKPGTTMPNVMAHLPPEDRREAAIAITHFLVGNDSVIAGSKSGNSSTGERLFHQSGCVACHASRVGSSVNAATSVPLSDLGEKYSRASLEEFLKNPLAVRPSGRMPRLDLGGDNWRHIAQYLTGDSSVTFGNARDLPKEPNLKFSAYFKSVDRLPDLDQLDPDLTGVSRGLDIGVGQRDENVVIRYDGFLPIEQPGRYSFRLSSDDGSRLFIDDKLIIDNDGVHGVEAKEATISLGVGAHAIRVDWFEKSGGEELALAWAGPGVKSGRIDKALIMNRDGADVPAEIQALPEDPDVFIFDESKVQVGGALFSALGCAACHDRNHDGKQMESVLVAPALDQCDTSHGCLATSPSERAPNFDLTAIQRGALAEAMDAAATDTQKNAGQRVSHQMKSLNCYACHQRDGIGGVEQDRNGYFASSIPEMGDEGRLPPPLNGVGDKLRETWTKEVIAHGSKQRPYMQTYMPHFGDTHASQFAKWFKEADMRTESKIPANKESELRQVAVGRLLVGAKGLGCVSCHTYGKFGSTGIQAIALDTMAKRLREDWFHRYLVNPQLYRPGTRMPTGFPDGKSTVPNVYEGDPPLQTKAMWSFLEKGTDGGVPDGIVGGMIELTPDREPVIYRNFIEGVSPRGIAVGYPEKANLCWDAEQLALKLVWQNRFIDASKHWVGRGPGKQSPLGGSVLTLEQHCAVAMLEDDTKPWPTSLPSERGFQFLGYRLDSEGRPTFRFRSPFARIEDKPIPVAGEFDGTFRREITIEPIDGEIEGIIFFRAATGQIESTSGGDYLVDGRLRIGVESAEQPMLRNVNGSMELLVPVKGKSTITQRIVW